ncbi:MAG: bacterial transcriptional activator domain-containing protein [Lachnospiraceae bacterium]
MKNDLRESPDPVLTIRMLGGFQLSYGHDTIKETSSHSCKLWNLLAYLITYHTRPITQSELIDIGWPDSEGINPLSSLKAAFSRTRTLLLPITPKDSVLILSSPGSYRWNESIPISLDIELFEHLCKSDIEKKVPIPQRIHTLKQALELYEGDFLPRQKNESWVIPLSAHFHSLYLNAAKELHLLLKQENRVSEMVDISTKALSIDFYDEKLHCNLIESLALQGNLAAALSHYEKASDFLYKNISVQCSPELEQIHHTLICAQSKLEIDSSSIIKSLTELDTHKGAFLCDYNVFEELYRLEARNVHRSKIASYVCIITIMHNNEVPTLDILNDAMPRLLSSIMDCLRSTDAVSKCNGAQYILLLPLVDYKNAEKIVHRIQTSYYNKNRKSTLHLRYELLSLQKEI